LPAEAVVRVGVMQEFATLTEAVASFEAGAEGTVIVHQADYNEAVTVDGGRVVAFVANEGDLPLWILAGGGSPQLTVLDGTVLMDGIQMSGNSSSMDPGLLVDGGRAWVDRGRIVTNLGGGIVAQAGAELVLRNCFVGGNVDDVDGVALDSSVLTMIYTTVGAGGDFAAQSRALFCTVRSSVDIRNSILMSADDVPEIQCSGVSISGSATESMVGFDAGLFTNYIVGDFTLTALGDSTFAGLAQWQDGDPATDIDGDPRPTVDATADYAGADVPQ